MQQWRDNRKEEIWKTMKLQKEGDNDSWVERKANQGAYNFIKSYKFKSDKKGFVGKSHNN